MRTTGVRPRLARVPGGRRGSDHGARRRSGRADETRGHGGPTSSGRRPACTEDVLTRDRRRDRTLGGPESTLQESSVEFRPSSSIRTGVVRRPVTTGGRRRREAGAWGQEETLRRPERLSPEIDSQVYIVRVEPLGSTGTVERR